MGCFIKGCVPKEEAVDELLLSLIALRAKRIPGQSVVSGLSISVFSTWLGTRLWHLKNDCRNLNKCNESGPVVYPLAIVHLSSSVFCVENFPLSFNGWTEHLFSQEEKTKLTGFILLNITFMFYRVLRVGSRWGNFVPGSLPGNKNPNGFENIYSFATKEQSLLMV